MHIKRFLLGALITSLIAVPVEATSSEKDSTKHLVEKGDLLAKDATNTRDDQCHAVSKEMKSAAEQGNAKAQVELAHRYLKGDGVERDLSQALYWYRQAAAQGDADAQYNLAIMYEYGWGVEKDIAQAVDWYRKAMDQGHEGAFRALEIHFTPE